MSIKLATRVSCLLIAAAFFFVIASSARAERPTASPAASTTQPATDRALTTDDPLRAGDLVSISVLDLAGPGKAMTVTRRLGESGTFSFPYAGALKLGGLQPAAAEKTLRDALQTGGVIDKATVIVTRPEAGEACSIDSAWRGGQ